MQPLFDLPEPILAPVVGGTHAIPVLRIFCVGRNYEAHAREMGVQVDREAPFYFTKGRDAYLPSGSTIAYPPGTENYHYEMELVAVIGRPAFRVSEEDALDAVFGYACGLDMTRRDLQLEARAKQRPWDLGKDFEQSAVLSDIIPADIVGHLHDGRIELLVNGDVKQSADISQLIHPVAAIVSHLSHYYHLQPGDLIYTGTPEGVGPVVPGDHIEGSIEKLGSISLTVGNPE